MLAAFPDSVDATERCRRLIDLFVVSVLVDAGAGTQWTFKSAENGRIYRRSEGIAVASYEMFKSVCPAILSSYEQALSMFMLYDIDALTHPRACSQATLRTLCRPTRLACGR